MKNRIMISVLCICMLLTASGCGAGIEGNVPSDDNRESATVIESDQEKQTESDDYHEEMTEDTEESDDYNSGSAMSEPEGNTDAESEEPSDDNSELPAITESEQGEPTETPDQYAELIAAATECIEGKVEEEPEDYYDFTYIIYRYGAHYGASLGLGYLIEDIDGNGTEELIFGQNDEPDSAWNGVIYDLYTISDGELVHVFSGGERDIYNLCENGLIANEGADGAAMSVFAYYSFEGKELHLVEAVIYNGWEDSENPWFYSTQSESMYETESMESVSEEQAWAIIEKYVYEHPTFIPFVEE